MGNVSGRRDGNGLQGMLIVVQPSHARKASTSDVLRFWFFRVVSLFVLVGFLPSAVSLRPLFVGFLSCLVAAAAGGARIHIPGPIRGPTSAGIVIILPSTCLPGLAELSRPSDQAGTSEKSHTTVTAIGERCLSSMRPSEHGLLGGGSEGREAVNNVIERHGTYTGRCLRIAMCQSAHGGQVARVCCLSSCPCGGNPSWLRE